MQLLGLDGLIARQRALMPLRMLLAFSGAAVAIVLITVLTYRAQGASVNTARWVSHTFQVIRAIEKVLSISKDAETGQRGYLLTSEEQYLKPLVGAQVAIQPQIDLLGTLTADNPAQQERLARLAKAVAARVALAQQTVDLVRINKAGEAVAIIKSGQGLELMAKIQALCDEMHAAETALLDERTASASRAVAVATSVTLIGGAMLFFFVCMTALMTSRDFRARETEAWLRAGQAALGLRTQGEHLLRPLGESILQFLAQFMGAQVGAIYIADGPGFRRFAGYALADSAEHVVQPGQGVIGEAARDDKMLLIRDLPAGHLPVRTGTGESAPRTLLIAPAHVEGRVNAVIELGFFREVSPADQEMLRRASETVGIAVRSAGDRQRLQLVLEETQQQAEELQTQQEELRVANEELEEQSRALKESQARLEQQQAELEQTNTQLEEQTQILAAQKNRLVVAQAELMQKAEELDRSNHYKSEFLANMSHELRTPLNSSLILAKLLADNKGGNLTPEQVQFAQTISAAGNDLLALINDILDLSKIEAGKAEVRVETVKVADLVESLARTFEPMAAQKSLALSIRVEPDAAVELRTDGQRLGQILKNLLSNALKFTAQGTVTLTVRRAGDAHLRFAVQDTGIGIAPEQQEVIFQAFRQADGSTHRKYGGTGLGLSISRDLARLLGGDIAVSSVVGHGAVFTLDLPLHYAGPPATFQGVLPARPSALPAAPEQRVVAQPRHHAKPSAGDRRPAIADDREAVRDPTRVILLIEDDPHFALIMRDLTRELDFSAVLAASGAEGLAAAERYLPSAIILDMNLPDQLGLVVLDQLKRNPATRHIPVHVVSAHDYGQEALERGAVGYALKPVQREELIDALRLLEKKLSQGVRRVLVVEDDARQRDSIGALLSGDDVQIVAVATAREAIDQLSRTTFDCMVMDLNLPDMSGFELLQELAETARAAFPPVIVYTGRSLTRDEDQQLRRFSRSIIVKDARSPERLLDEVTLFLHQVEAKLPPERQRMLRQVRDRDELLDGKRVLVVEDDVRNIFALSSVLEPKGAKVAIARNGREAIAALERAAAAPDGGFDLILMDVMMPEMDGLTATREIRKQPRWAKVPIIALTAKAMPDDRDHCLAAGMSDYIAKPLDVEKLLSLVRVWIAR